MNQMWPSKTWPTTGRHQNLRVATHIKFAEHDILNKRLELQSYIKFSQKMIGKDTLLFISIIYTIT